MSWCVAHRFQKGLCDAGLVLAAALVALSCGDMHYTARYFHERTETTLGALLGLLAFQIPMAWWLLYGFTLPLRRAQRLKMRKQIL